MISIPAYFDGNTVRPIGKYNFEKNQRLLITVLEESTEGKEKDALTFPTDGNQDVERRLSLLAGLQKYRGRLPDDFDAEKELAEARERKYSK